MRKILFALSFVFLITACKSKEAVPAPKAEFTYTINEEGSVNFVSVSTNAVKYDYAIDNTHNLTKDFTYVFPANKSYQVSLTATNSDNVSDVVVKTINITNITGSLILWKGPNQDYPSNIFVAIDEKYFYTIDGRYSQIAAPSCATTSSGTLSSFTRNKLTPGEHEYRFNFGPYITGGKVNIVGRKCTAVEIVK